MIKFGIFVPQGWRMDLAEIEDPIEKYEAMTGVARAADPEEGWDSVWVFDHFHTVPTPELWLRRSRVRAPTATLSFAGKTR